MYDNFSRAPADEVDAGDICAVTGLPDVSIGETICSRTQPEPLPTITVRTVHHHWRACLCACSSPAEAC